MSAVATGYSPGFVTSKSVAIEDLFTRLQPRAAAIGGLVTPNAMRLAREIFGRPVAQERYNALAAWAKDYREELGPWMAMSILPDEFCLVVEEVRFDVFSVDFYNPPRWRGRSSVKWDNAISAWRPSGRADAVAKGVMG